MHRRDLLKLLLASAAAEFVDYEKLLWIPGEKKIFLPSVEPVNLYGIPYHLNNAFSGTWMGIERTKFPWVWKPRGSSGAITKEILDLITRIQKLREEIR